ncbi:MAG: hypothetical protein ACU88J_12695 [Gammaproteobacteria bacterium]
MFSLNRLFLSILSLFILFWHPIAHAESNGLYQKDYPLQTQIQQLQTQLKDANSKINILEIAMNRANKNINDLQYCESRKGNSHSQLNTTNTVVGRVANGHGR